MSLLPTKNKEERMQMFLHTVLLLHDNANQKLSFEQVLAIASDKIGTPVWYLQELYDCTYKNICWAKRLKMFQEKKIIDSWTILETLPWLVNPYCGKQKRELVSKKYKKLKAKHNNKGLSKRQDKKKVLQNIKMQCMAEYNAQVELAIKSPEDWAAHFPRRPFVQKDMVSSPSDFFANKEPLKRGQTSSLKLKPARQRFQRERSSPKPPPNGAAQPDQCYKKKGKEAQVLEAKMHP